MYLEVMIVIFVMILGRFESARVLVHPLPEPLNWEKSFIDDHCKGNLEDWTLTQFIFIRPRTCRDAYKAMHVKPQTDTHEPLVSEEHFENSSCNESHYVDTVEINIQHAIEEVKNGTFKANVVDCVCTIPNPYYYALTTRRFYLAKTKRIQSLYILDNTWTIKGYWTYIPAEAFPPSIFRCFLPD